MSSLLSEFLDIKSSSMRRCSTLMFWENYLPAKVDLMYSRPVPTINTETAFKKFISIFILPSHETKLLKRFGPPSSKSNLLELLVSCEFGAFLSN